jgi:ABC-type multidrug transport system permease subunit
MKLYRIIEKNFKILFRSKASAIVVVLGPLMIIALISLALSNTQDYSITTGVVALDNGELTEQFLTQLGDKGFTILHFETIEECIEKIKLGTANICIKLPENFKVENDKINDVEFFVDQSRINLVESVISSVSSIIGSQSEDIALSLTQNLIDTIDVASEGLEKEIVAVNQIKLKAKSIDSSTETIKAKGDNTELSNKTALTQAKTNVDIIKTSSGILEEDTDNLLKKLDSHLGGLDPAPSGLSEKYDELKGSSETEFSKLSNASADLGNLIDDIDGKIDSANDNIALIKSNADTVKTEMDNIKDQVSLVETSLKTTQDKIDVLQITSASSIVNSFNISISPILASSEKSIYMFPYFLTLIILFVGVMLSSSLIVMEKKSRAFFKTFTTPTNELYHVLGGYVTNFTILFTQLAVILGAAAYYLKLALFQNLLVTVVILISSVTFFILLGTLIGYIFKTQEGTTIASISVGSLFLFLSNVVLPVESFSPMIRKVLSATPYMLSAELIKESVLFKVGFSGLKGKLLLLGAYILVATLLVIVFQKLSISRMFTGSASKNVLKRPHITRENSFRLNSGALLTKKEDLHKALKKMSEEEYISYVNKKGNEFALWVRDAFSDKKLARRMKKSKSREELVNLLAVNLLTGDFQVKEEVKEKKVEKRVEMKDSDLASKMRDAFTDRKLARKMKKCKSKEEIVDLLAENLEETKQKEVKEKKPKKEEPQKPLTAEELMKASKPSIKERLFFFRR